MNSTHTTDIQTIDFDGKRVNLITHPIVTLGLTTEQQNQLRSCLSRAVEHCALSYYQKNNVWRFVNNHHNDLFSYIDAPHDFTHTLPRPEDFYDITLQSTQEDFAALRFVFTPRSFIEP